MKKFSKEKFNLEDSLDSLDRISLLNFEEMNEIEALINQDYSSSPPKFNSSGDEKGIENEEIAEASFSESDSDQQEVTIFIENPPPASDLKKVNSSTNEEHSIECDIEADISDSFSSSSSININLENEKNSPIHPSNENQRDFLLDTEGIISSPLIKPKTELNENIEPNSHFPNSSIDTTSLSINKKLTPGDTTPREQERFKESIENEYIKEDKDISDSDESNDFENIDDIEDEGVETSLLISSPKNKNIISNSHQNSNISSLEIPLSHSPSLESHRNDFEEIDQGSLSHSPKISISPLKSIPSTHTYNDLDNGQIIQKPSSIQIETNEVAIQCNPESISSHAPIVTNHYLQPFERVNSNTNPTNPALIQIETDYIFLIALQQIKQQLQIQERFNQKNTFINSNYHYCTFQDVQEQIQKKIPPPLTFEQALQLIDNNIRIQ